MFLNRNCCKGVFVCLEFQIFWFVIRTFTPIFFIEISFVFQKRLAWALFCYQPSCAVSQGSFCFINFPNLLPQTPYFEVSNRAMRQAFLHVFHNIRGHTHPIESTTVNQTEILKNINEVGGWGVSRDLQGVKHRKFMTQKKPKSTLTV